MRKRYICIGALLIFGLALFLVLKNNFLFVSSTFNGDRVRNPDGYYLDFTIMSQDDSCDLKLEAGDELHASWEIEKGTVNIRIQSESGEVIYQGDKIDTADFRLSITESGTYTVYVSARKAKGRISVELK